MHLNRYLTQCLLQRFLSYTLALYLLYTLFDISITGNIAVERIVRHFIKRASKLGPFALFLTGLHTTLVAQNAGWIKRWLTLGIAPRHLRRSWALVSGLYFFSGIALYHWALPLTTPVADGSWSGESFHSHQAPLIVQKGGVTLIAGTCQGATLQNVALHDAHHFYYAQRAVCQSKQLTLYMLHQWHYPTWEYRTSASTVRLPIAIEETIRTKQQHPGNANWQQLLTYAHNHAWNAWLHFRIASLLVGALIPLLSFHFMLHQRFSAKYLYGCFFLTLFIALALLQSTLTIAETGTIAAGWLYLYPATMLLWFFV